MSQVAAALRACRVVAHDAEYMDTNIAINLRVTVAMYRAKAAVKTAPVAVMTPRQVGIKKWAIQEKMYDF